MYVFAYKSVHLILAVTCFQSRKGEPLEGSGRGCWNVDAWQNDNALQWLNHSAHHWSPGSLLHLCYLVSAAERSCGSRR